MKHLSGENSLADEGAGKPRILFVVHTSTAFVECFRLAKLLVRAGMRPGFIFAYAGDWTVDRFMDDCRSASIEVHRHPPQNAKLLDIVRQISQMWSRRFPSAFLSFLVNLPLEVLQLRKSLANVRTMFKSLKPDLLILSLDLAGYDSSTYVRIAHQAGKKALVLSSLMSIGLSEAEVYYHDREHHVSGMLGRWIARLFPKWVITHRGRQIFRVPPARILAMELLGLAPPKPWLFNSSWADAINMESAAMVEYSAFGGMPREKMILTGSTTDDIMASVIAELPQRRNELCRSLGLPPDRPIILCAIPPNFLVRAGGRPECDFDGDFDGLVDFWLRCCADIHGHNVVVALHPSVPPSEFQKFERYGARVSSLNTAELMPLCDIFVASVSSVIRWAIACGKPVVNYDVYRYRYDVNFGHVEGVLTCEEKEEFQQLLNKLAFDAAFAADIRHKQQIAAPQWGHLDGRSGERLVAWVERFLPTEASGQAFNDLRKRPTALLAHG